MKIYLYRIIIKKAYFIILSVIVIIGLGTAVFEHWKEENPIRMIVCSIGMISSVIIMIIHIKIINAEKKKVFVNKTDNRN